MASEVSWTRPGGRVALVQDTDYPAAGVVRPTIREPGTGRFTLKVRIPAWVGGATVRIDGRTGKVAPGALAEMRRDWKAGDTVDVVVPQPLRTVPLEPQTPDIAALMRGGVMYVGLNPWDGIAEQAIDLPGSLSPIPGSAQAYRTVVSGRDLVLAPYYAVDTERYHTYFRHR